MRSSNGWEWPVAAPVDGMVEVPAKNFDAYFRRLRAQDLADQLFCRKRRVVDEFEIRQT
jgi:hypothetical protein